MNRKQKVAIVVGALVIAFLALFPPWVSVKLAHVTTQGPVAVYVRYGHRWYLSGEQVEKAYVTIDHDTQYALQLAALALTVAAVVVLKERKAGA